MKKCNSRKREFSKIIAVIGMSMWVLVTIYALVMMVLTRDLSPLAYVIGSVDAVVGVICTFYFAKASKENQIKLRQTYGDLAREVE
jgi:uncharacterized membrane-anchored protein